YVRPVRSRLFPYTTLFRSGGSAPPDEKIIGEGVFQPKTKVMESGALSGAQIVETDEDGEFGILVVKKPQATVYEVGDIIIVDGRSEEHTSELQSRFDLVCS